VEALYVGLGSEVGPVELTKKKAIGGEISSESRLTPRKVTPARKFRVVLEGSPVPYAVKPRRWTKSAGKRRGYYTQRRQRRQGSQMSTSGLKVEWGVFSVGREAGGSAVTGVERSGGLAFSSPANLGSYTSRPRRKSYQREGKGVTNPLPV